MNSGTVSQWGWELFTARSISIGYFKTEATQLLPRLIIDWASLRGREYAWKPERIPDVFKAAEDADLAVIGGQLQFRIPQGTCELYWIEFESKSKDDAETWQQFVKRSIDECFAQFSELNKKFDFISEGVKTFKILKEMQESGFKLTEYLCFVVYFDSESTYRNYSNE